MSNELPSSRSSVAMGRWLSEGLIVAAFPAVAYLVTFTYEAGSAMAFGIPLSWISLNLTNVFIVTGVLFGAIAQAFNFASILYLFIPALGHLGEWAKDHPWRRVLVRNVLPGALVLIVVGLVAYASDAGWALLLFISIVVGLMAFAGLGVEFLLPLFTQRRIKAYQEKLAEQERIDASVESLGDRIVKILGPDSSGPIVLLGMMFAVAFFAGNAAAIKQKAFLVSRTSPELAVLRTYGNLLVCAPVDRKSQTIERSFLVLTLGADPKMQFDVAEIGPLHGLHPIIAFTAKTPSSSPTRDAGPAQR